MVLQKRLDYGSSGYQAPPILHVPRSARGKRSTRRKFADSQMCAFDLLATVAGKILMEGENSSSLVNITGSTNPSSAKDSVKQEQFDEVKPFKTESLDRNSCNEGTLGSTNFIERQVHHLKTPKDAASGSNSAFANVLDKEETKVSTTRAEFGFTLGTILEKDATGRSSSPGSVGSVESKGDEMKRPFQDGVQKLKNEIDSDAPDMNSLVDRMDLDVKPPALVSSDSSAEMPLYRYHIPRCSSFPKYQDRRKSAVDRDDDENSSGCTHPGTITNKAFRPHRRGDRRVRRLLVSKFRKVVPSRTHKGEFSNSDVEAKSSFRCKKMCSTRQRTQRTMFKRRKLFERCLVSPSGGIFSEGISNSPAKSSIKMEASDSHATLHGANRASSSMNGQKPSYGSEDYHVKLSIKSFKVPELFIEIPETATVGSLKRTVMEAVTAILGGGLRVGVLLQGKKVRDDNKTLQQAGISHGDKLENVGFTLEPNATQAPPQLTISEDSQFLGTDDVVEPLARILPLEFTPVHGHGMSTTTPRPVLTSLANCPDSDHDSVHSPTDVSAIGKTPNSRALVTVPPMNAEALAVVPLRKSRRCELAQRRIRRPFSVAEVEALVQAVEKIGTGRWRDVKIRAFDNAKHRTYVDLKDKWKTLVHTARISPQQRRGEPVPQELLDRVLSAQAHWSQQQARLHAKPPVVPETCLTA
ncbi:telomere-binding protein 1-like [Typha angustifolia]|uniref:telomere-binding protein 1-like n=1 Tax=Typha angustifolia TaxID=59011 RepID=UPI003C2C420F